MAKRYNSQLELEALSRVDASAESSNALKKK
jgi:hypothetical protein